MPDVSLKNGPNVALVASLIGEPARAAMLTALMSGKALTASELAREAGVTAATASSHLAKLEDGGLLVAEKQGRHRYMRLADSDVADAIESLMGVAARAGHLRTRTGPRDPAMRHARVCYNHLAGDVAVGLFDHFTKTGLLKSDATALTVTPSGEAAFKRFGIEINDHSKAGRALCRRCLDWSERKSHLGGPLGVALLSEIITRGWAHRDRTSRAVVFAPRGEANLRRHFGMTT
jgi:DNA-binding transcriptional ArsR family regulator